MNTPWPRLYKGKKIKGIRWVHVAFADGRDVDWIYYYYVSHK